MTERMCKHGCGRPARKKCLQCHTCEYASESNRERCKARAREWYAANKELRKAATAAWQAANPDKMRSIKVASRERARLGLSLSQYRKMLADPNYHPGDDDNEG